MNQEDNTSAPNRSETEAGSEATVDAGVWVPALKEAAWAFLAAALLLVVTYTIFFRSFHPEFIPFIDRDARKLVVTGKDLIPVSVGAASKSGNQIIIEDFNEDEAVLLLPRAFQAEDYPFIKVNLSGITRYSKLKIIWRRADDMAQSYALEFNRSGDEVTQIAMVYGGEKYRGKIADIALLFYDGPALGFENNNDVDIVIDSIEFLPFSAARVAEQIYEDWTNPPLLQSYSTNVVRGAHRTSILMPNAVSNSLFALGLALLFAYFLAQRKNSESDIGLENLMASAMCLLFYGWLANELLRSHWRHEELQNVFSRYASTPFQERIYNAPDRCARGENCFDHLLPYF